MQTSPSPVGDLLRKWRAARGKSQLALAVHAGVSSRHLSFVETGRANPSREMILLLGDALEVPLRERNALLEAAGYAAVFKETPLEAPEMNEVRRALDALLAANEKSPAVVVNRRCDVLMSNEAARRFMAFLLPPHALTSGAASNMVRLIFSPDGARPFIENWEEVASEIAYRLRREAFGDDTLRELMGPGVELPLSSPALTRSRAGGQLSALLPIRIRRGDVRLDLFSTITTLGTPLDVTLQELRLESLFPADAASARELAAILKASPLT